MNDLKNTTTGYPSAVDTYTLWADTTDDVVAASINNALSAIIAIEAELGVSAKGSSASVAARLGVNLAQNGAIPSGTSFPVSPTPTGGQFYVRTDYSPWRLYLYDGTLAQWTRIESITDHGVLTGLTDDDHTQYVHNTTARTISANHTFSGNPTFSGTPTFTHAIGVSPFTVTSTTKVANLNADLLDDLTTATASTVSTIAARDSNGDLTSRVLISDVAIGTAPLTVTSTTKVTNLNSEQVDGFDASQTPGANQVVVLDSSGNLPLGSNTVIRPLDANANEFGVRSKTRNVYSTKYNTDILANGYFDGSNYKYVTTGVASRIIHDYNGLAYYTYPSGTANGTFGSATTYKFMLAAGATQVYTKIVDIGDWDMNATTNVAVAHGLTASKILGVTGYIVNDGATLYHPIGAQAANPAATVTELWSSSWTSTDVNLYRLTSGIYDNTNYDSTSYNRGKLFIFYTE